MTLFDNINRKPFADAGRNLPTFSYFNQFDEPSFQNTRSLVESWFNNFPSESRDDVRARFRSTDNRAHEGALLELFLHELFLFFGCRIRVHPEITNINPGKLTPDFLVSHWTRSFYLEATTTGQTSGPFTYGPNEQDVIDKLNTLTSKDFHIGVDMEGTLSRTLRREHIVGRFEELLTVHDPNEVQQLIDMEGMYAAPSQKIVDGDWSLEGWLIPIPPEGRISGHTGEIVIAPYRAKSINSKGPVRDRIKRKASKYRILKEMRETLVVAANLRDMFAGSSKDDIGKQFDLGVLFGDETLYSRNQAGIWGQGRYTRISAVMMLRRIDLWNLSQASACVYINPWRNITQLPDVLYQLPYASLANDGSMKWEDCVDIAALMGCR